MAHLVAHTSTRRPPSRESHCVSFVLSRRARHLHEHRRRLLLTATQSKPCRGNVGYLYLDYFSEAHTMGVGRYCVALLGLPRHAILLSALGMGRAGGPPSAPHLAGVQILRGFGTTTTMDIPPLPKEEDKEEEGWRRVSSRPPLPPIITSRPLLYPPKFSCPRQAWVENLDTVEETKLGMVDLHPQIFAASPRLDILHQNVLWQNAYKRIRWATAKTRAECRGGGRKPWPQKGTGRARHGSIRSPLWYKGGVAHGPRGPKTYFYVLPFHVRVKGLITALSVKFAQDDLRIVDSLEIPTDDPKFLETLAEERSWGVSVLFVDESDVMPRNVSLATESIGHFNLMPVYGLNVYSMLKHETLVLTLGALKKIEEKLLFQLNRLDTSKVNQI